MTDTRTPPGPVRVRIHDVDTDEVLDDWTVADFLVVCADGWHVSYEQRFANGTTQVTIKPPIPREAPGD